MSIVRRCAFLCWQKLEESGKECLGANRVDAEALVQELIESTDLGVNESEESEAASLTETR